MNSTTEKNIKKTQVVVLGAGPGGYSAAFRCADLGIKTTIVERYPNLGGICLNVGCIPSKTLLNIIKIINNAKIMKKNGIINEEITFDINQIRIQKEKIIKQLAQNLHNIAKMKHIEIINGYGKFIDNNNMHIKTFHNNDNDITIHFENIIIATGSYPDKLSLIPYDDCRIWDSTEALKLKNIPKKLLIIGAGSIGLEMATIYHALGSKVDIIEILDQPIPTIADRDIIKLFIQYTKEKFNIILETKITAIESKENGIYVHTEDKNSKKEKKRYDNILVATGRLPNNNALNTNQIKTIVNQFGFIHVDNQMRTNIPNIFAIGDIIGPPMLAHKSTHEGRIAAEVIAGMKRYFDPKIIPSVVYTDPEIASAGFTETTAKAHNINYKISNFPWSASGHAIASNAQYGMTKLIFDKKTHRIIGGTIIGKNASELLGEIGLAIEMGCDAEDIALTIHAHPSLSETIGLAASIYEDSTNTDLLNFKSQNN